ncbi:polyketide synthase, partial [Aspergillus heteromorphus CBS 117.55]
RLLLEYTYQALENAGLSIDAVSGSRTSVYSGSFSTDWQHMQLKDGETCRTTAILGQEPCVNANRISWFFNLHGNS